jgi:hypothetical protein
MRTKYAKFLLDYRCSSPVLGNRNTRWRIAGRLATYIILFGRQTPGTQLFFGLSIKESVLTEKEKEETRKGVFCLYSSLVFSCIIPFLENTFPIHITLWNRTRHCERSEAIHEVVAWLLDRRASLAMTDSEKVRFHNVCSIKLQEYSFSETKML